MIVLLSKKYVQVWKIYECGNIYKIENLFKKKAAEYASVLTKTEAKNSHMASVLTITEVKKSAKIWIKKKNIFHLWPQSYLTRGRKLCIWHRF